MQLRPYQDAAIEGAREQFRRGAKRCLIIMPTGGGKTVCAAAIIAAAEARGSRVLFLAHRRELITQTADKLMRCGVKPGLIIAGQPRALQRAVQVASVQTLARHPDLLRAVDLIFIDEAHHFVEESQYGDVLKFHAGARVVGLTATPWRLDGKGLADVFDSHVIASTPAKLRDEGYLVNVVGWTFVAVSTSSAKVKGGDFTGQSMEAAALAPKLVGNVVQEWKARAGGARSVLFACTIAHSQAMALAFRDAGVAAEHLDGSTPAGERAAILSRIRSGATRVLCNVNVATEGWDCLDDQTEVLTAQGWRGRGQVAAGDQVYSLNRDTGHLELTPATRSVERVVNPGERMVRIKSQHTDIRVTEGHQLHFKYRTRKGLSEFQTATAGEIALRRSAYALPLAAPPAVDLPGVPLTDDELRFVAWFMTDGGFEGTNVCISQAKTHRDGIRALLSRLQFDLSERVRTNQQGFAAEKALPLHVFRVPRGTHPGMPRRGWDSLAPYLSKDVSPLLHEMSVRQFRLFWEELLKGDGEQQGDKTGWLWCDRAEQADAYTQMAVVRGLSASFSERTTAKGHRMFRVSVRDRQWLVTDPADRRSARAARVEPLPGERVWCVTNRNSTLVTRRNGKIVILGNCPELECVMLCRPTLSTSLALQMIGRGLRPFEGKTVARIHDHAGIFGAHGHPYAERSWSPELTAEVERSSMKDGGEARVTSCPKCRAVVDQWPCANCGFREPPKELPETAEGVAVQVSESAAWQAAMAKEEERKGREFRFRNLSESSRRESFFRFVERCHGNVKQAAGRYRWFSGETAWPPRQWNDEALVQLAQAGAR